MIEQIPFYTQFEFNELSKGLVCQRQKIPVLYFLYLANIVPAHDRIVLYNYYLQHVLCAFYSHFHLLRLDSYLNTVSNH